MNSKFLVWTSLLIALLLHLALFNLTTFVFQIDPATLKPKFFFLGQILGKNDVIQISPRNGSPTPNTMFKNIHSKESRLRSMGPKIVDQEKSPFAIQAIKKPLMPQSKKLQKKTVIKPTFESLPEKEAEVQQRSSSELKIHPYKPLKFRSPYQ